MKPHVMFFCMLNPITELFTSQQDPPADGSVTSWWEKLSGSDVADWFTVFLLHIAQMNRAKPSRLSDHLHCPLGTSS